MIVIERKHDKRKAVQVLSLPEKEKVIPATNVVIKHLKEDHCYEMHFIIISTYRRGPSGTYDEKVKVKFMIQFVYLLRFFPCFGIKK